MKKGTSRLIEELNETCKFETLSSGVTVKVIPFPARLWEKIQADALEKYPEPIPPKKTIKVLNGTEEVDDLNNPEYVELKEERRKQRDSFMAEPIGNATLDLCVEVDIEPYEAQLNRVAQYSRETLPTETHEKKIYFLQNFAMRGRADYERVSIRAIQLMQVGDAEVADRIKSFRNDVAQPATNGTHAPSAPEIERLEVEQAQEGTVSG